MELAYYIAAAVATAATVMVVISTHAVHALLYLIVSFLGVATIMFLLGAPFAAALEVIVYAGAIVVLFVFVVMMLNVGESMDEERRWIAPRAWIGPAVLAGALLAVLIRAIVVGDFRAAAGAEVDARQVGLAMYGPYLLAVELAAVLLLAGFVAAYHLGRREDEEQRY